MTGAIKVNREQLLHELETVKSGLSDREIVEQSSCFVFRGGIVHTYNDEMACQQRTSLKIEGAVKATPLISILEKLPESEVEVLPGDEELLIVGKRRKAGIRMEQEILLPIEVVPTPTKWRVLHAEFSDAVSMVQQCAGRDESQFAITCVHINKGFVEAFDNYQLARYTVDTGIRSKSILIRRGSAKQVASLGVTHVGETENWVHFKNDDGLMISCRRYVEDYPELDELLAVDGVQTSLPKGLAEACDKASVFSADNPDDDMIAVEILPGKIRIKGTGASGWYTESKKARYKGQPLTFSIPPALLIEIVKQHNQCEVSESRLKVDGGKFTYVTCLQTMDETRATDGEDE